MNIDHTNEPCTRENCDVYRMIDDLSTYAKDAAFFAANIALRTARGEAPSSAINAVKTAMAVMIRSQKLGEQLKLLADNYDIFLKHAAKYRFDEAVDLDSFQDLLKAISDLTGASPEELLATLTDAANEGKPDTIVLGIDPTTGKIKRVSETMQFSDSLPSEIASILNSKQETPESLDKEINDFLKP